jgi:hypothetical protein
MKRNEVGCSICIMDAIFLLILRATYSTLRRCLVPISIPLSDIVWKIWMCLSPLLVSLFGNSLAWND